MMKTPAPKFKPKTMLGSHWSDERSVRITAVDKVSVHMKSFDDWINETFKDTSNDQFDGEICLALAYCA